MKKIKRIGVLTGGGDCPGLNAVIRAVVNTAIRNYGIEVYYSGLINKTITKLELKDVSGILPRGGTILGTSNRDNPFKYKTINSKGEKEYKDVSVKVIKTIEYNEIDVLITIGGDGTQAIANKLFEKCCIPVIGVPKTIDNDLNGTDVTFGFNTALSIATSSIDKLHSTAESHHRIMVIEVMGRYAGWIAMESGLAGGGDVILIPEIPFKMEKIAEKIYDRKKIGKRFDPIRLGGISNYVGNKIEDITGTETRYTILGHVQRGGSPTAFDRILATRFGYHAVETAIKGQFGYMVGIRGQDIKTIPIKEAIKVPRRIKPQSDLVKTAMAVGTSFGI
jgi:6-phosphofructokinase 1